MNNNIQRKKFNLSILGEKTVGKTCLVESLLGMPFNEKQISTIGIDTISHKFKIDGKEYVFKIFDTAGQERYNSVAATTIKIADGFLLVYSVNNKESLEKINVWIQNIEDFVNRKEKVLMLVGNKIDIKERIISKEEGMAFAKERNMKYFETSAKTGFGIKEAFNQIFNDIYELNKKGEENQKSKNVKQTTEKNSSNQNNENIVLGKKEHKKKNKSKFC